MAFCPNDITSHYHDRRMATSRPRFYCSHELPSDSASSVRIFDDQSNYLGSKS